MEKLFSFFFASLKYKIEARVKGGHFWIFWVFPINLIHWQGDALALNKKSQSNHKVFFDWSKNKKMSSIIFIFSIDITLSA